MNQEPNNPTKCPICGRPTHKESKYCIFHASVEKKTEEEFKKALKEYIDKTKKEDNDYHFEKFIFVGYINFKEDFDIEIFKKASFFEAIFEGNVFFLNVTFEGEANFFRTTFKGDTYFTNVPFEGEANFLSATFEGKAEFTEATFKVSTEFKMTSFKGDACFEGTIFNGHTTKFTNTTFNSNANFFVVKFKGNAGFEDATFKYDANFEEATFEGDADFRLKYFTKILNFSKIKTLSGKKLFIRSNNKEGKISFVRAHLENIYLDIELVEDIFIDFTDALLRNTKIKKDKIENHILHEKYYEFPKAQEIYLLLKNNFHSIGRYEDESWAFKKEKDMERKSYYSNVFTKNTESKEKKNEEKDQKVKKSKVILYSNWMKIKEFGKWIWSCFCNAIYGYGEKPCNVVISAGVIMIFFALLFSSIGISNPEIIDLKGITVNQNTGNIVDSASKGLLKNNVIRNISDSLYFSTITFTTLGYGDFRPIEGLGRILAGSEAFIGAFMMALFVYTFARRTGGR